jgi:hypothetical protein
LCITLDVDPAWDVTEAWAVVDCVDTRGEMRESEGSIHQMKQTRRAPARLDEASRRQLTASCEALLDDDSVLPLTCCLPRFARWRLWDA